MPHVGDVHGALEVIAAVAQIAVQHVLHDIGAQIADVGKVVDGGATGVHGALARLMGDKFLFLMGQRVI